MGVVCGGGGGGVLRYCANATCWDENGPTSSVRPKVVRCGKRYCFLSSNTVLKISQTEEIYSDGCLARVSLGLEGSDKMSMTPSPAS